ncbi:MAG: TonB-dependent receptor plug domain-containing protein, partial [Tidjanibacter sp.]|nr:TonB-dependent receptor plug domain-containing protein [Tidjanibacter sp.]
MKRNYVLLLWALLFTIVMSAQNKPLSLKLDKVSVKSAMEALSEQSGYTFFYKVGEVDTSKSVSINATRIEDAISQILAGQDDVAYELQGSTIVVSKKAPQAPKSQRAHAASQVEGNVYDSQNNPLVGVVVMTLDGAHAVTTDIKGHFAIAASKETVLEFSCLGYATRTEKVGTRTNMRIVLADDVQQMEAVVVVGYGTQKKVNLTGSVSMVNSEDLEARPISNVANGLQGILPGVTVTSASAQPGESNATIRVRGVGTLGNSNPLILIDGVEGDISVLNPEDIESVSVLKDAASASIYGARGANGVLLVTTKKLGSGEKIRPSVTFNSYVGVQTPTRLPEMCDAIEFMTLDNEARSYIGNAIAWLDDAFDKVRTGSDPN